MTAREVLALLRERYADAFRYACAAEVPSRTGCNDRRFDFVVVNCWQSDGYRIDVFEIKVSKSDLRHELEHPEKHNWAFDDIDRYWLACPEEIVDLDVIPKNWGVMVVRDGALVVKRKPIPLHDDKDHSRNLNRAWAISLMRAVSRSSVDKAEQARQVQEAKNEGYDNGYKEGLAKGSGFNPDEYVWMEKFCRSLGVYRQSDADKVVDDWRKLSPLRWTKDKVEISMDSLDRNIKGLKKTFSELFETQQAEKKPPEGEHTCLETPIVEP